MVFALYGRDDLAKDANLPPGPPHHCTFALAHNVRDKAAVDALLLQAQNAGGRILKPAADAPWGGYAGYFADPDGHPWEVAWNPGFALAPDGSIQLPR